MKKIFSTLFFLSSFSIIAIAQIKGTVTLKGQLKNFSNQVEVEDLSDLQYLLPASTERIIIPDSDGKFSIRFKLSSPNYFRIGRNIFILLGRFQGAIDLGKVSLAEIGFGLVRGAEVSQPSALAEETDVIAGIDVIGGVRDQDDGMAFIGQFAQQ